MYQTPGLPQGVKQTKPCLAELSPSSHALGLRIALGGPTLNWPGEGPRGVYSPPQLPAWLPGTWSETAGCARACASAQENQFPAVDYISQKPRGQCCLDPEGPLHCVLKGSAAWVLYSQAGKKSELGEAERDSYE